MLLTCTKYILSICLFKGFGDSHRWVGNKTTYFGVLHFDFLNNFGGLLYDLNFIKKYGLIYLTITSSHKIRLVTKYKVICILDDCTKLSNTSNLQINGSSLLSQTP